MLPKSLDAVKPAFAFAGQIYLSRLSRGHRRALTANMQGFRIRAPEGRGPLATLHQRSFRRICETKHVRLIKVNHIRHIVASLLKALGVLARALETVGKVTVLQHSRRGQART